MAIAVISNRVGAVTITFTLGAVTVIYTAAVPAAGVYYSSLVDCSRQRNVVFKVVNTCDQIISVQAIGNLTNDTAAIALIDGVMAVVALTGIITVGINLQGDDWHPYIGLQITVPAGVTLGTLVVSEIHRG